MDDTNQSKPIACTLTPAAQRAETNQLKAKLVPYILKREHLEDGARLTFTSAPGLRDTLNRLVQTDQGCCSFLTHQVDSDDKTITLTVRSTGEGIPLAQEFLTLLTPDQKEKPRGTNFKLLAIVGACGVACSAPLILGATGLSIAGIGLGAMGFELAALALIAFGTAVFYIYKRKKIIAESERKNNANRCSC